MAEQIFQHDLASLSGLELLTRSAETAVFQGRPAVRLDGLALVPAALVAVALGMALAGLGVLGFFISFWQVGSASAATASSFSTRRPWPSQRPINPSSSTG